MVSFPPQPEPIYTPARSSLVPPQLLSAMCDTWPCVPMPLALFPWQTVSSLPRLYLCHEQSSAQCTVGTVLSRVEGGGEVTDCLYLSASPPPEQP